MFSIRVLRGLAALALLAGAGVVQAASPTCVSPEVKMSWPSAANPVWELCWVAYGNSAGPDGSGLEIRKVHWNGTLVLKTAHSPLLFADYTSGTCYRDWKDQGVSFLAPPGVRNTVDPPGAFPATTSCDRSNDPVVSYGACPFVVAGRTSADCFTGVSIEDEGDHVVLTAQYVAGWYYYSSRFSLFNDGSFSPEFGFGNRDGTGNNTTHWHHNYWRLDFDIDGAADDQVLLDDTVQSTEFNSMRCNSGTTPSCAIERTWTVRDSVTGKGYRLLPGGNDYKIPANQSGHGYHLRDVLATVYHAGEYGDRTDNPLGTCGMNDAALVNSEDLDGATGSGTDVVLYYRAGVRDRTNEGPGTQDSMICKKVGPVFVPVGWNGADALFSNGFEG